MKQVGIRIDLHQIEHWKRSRQFAPPLSSSAERTPWISLHAPSTCPATSPCCRCSRRCTPPELLRLAEGCRLRRLQRGDTVFRVGEPCEEFHVAVTGQVKLFAISPAGQEKVIELIGPGQSFAEALMFTGKPYIINAQTLSDALVLSVGKDTVFGEISRRSALRVMRMLAGISRRLHGLVHDVQAYALHNGMQRVIGYLLTTTVGATTVIALRVKRPEFLFAQQCIWLMLLSRLLVIADAAWQAWASSKALFTRQPHK